MAIGKRSVTLGSVREDEARAGLCFARVEEGSGTSGSGCTIS